MTPEELLLKSAEIIERDGWHQGDLFASNVPEYVNGAATPEGQAAYSRAARTAPVCAMGAIYRGLYGTCRSSDVDATEYTVGQSVMQQAVKLLGDSAVRTRPGVGTIPEWNDHPLTTMEDVLLGFKRAAHHEGQD